MPKHPADQYFRLCIARVLHEDGHLEGAGFLVGRRSIITSTHVVSEIHPPVNGGPPSSSVKIDFPLFHSGAVHTATVISWQPPLPDGSGDIAVLRLDRPPSQRLEPARLLDVSDLWKHDFMTFGFPVDLDDGVWAHGKFLSRQAGGWIQIEADHTTGHAVQRGFSGAPVWDETIGGFVGMVVAAETQEATRGAYVLDAKALARASGAHLARFVNGGGPPPGRVDIDSVLTHRRAHSFGFQLGLLGRAEARFCSEEQVAPWRNECMDHADYLDVEFTAETPTASDATQALVARTEQANAISGRLSDRYDTATGAGFYLGFELALDPEMLPEFDAKMRAQVAHEQEQEAETAGLPTDVVAAVTDFIRESSASDMLKAAFDVNDRICAVYDSQLQSSPWLREVQANVWDFAAAAGLAAAGQGAGAVPNVVQEQMDEAQRSADELGLDVPVLPPATGDRISDQVTSLRYLLDDLTDEIADRLRFRYGPAAVEVLRLCTRMFALLIFYGPGSDEATAAADAVADAGEAAGLPQDLTIDLLSAVAKNASYEEIKSEVIAVNSRVPRWLRGDAGVGTHVASAPAAPHESQ